jgi:hypothetical protein
MAATKAMTTGFFVLYWLPLAQLSRKAEAREALDSRRIPQNSGAESFWQMPERNSYDLFKQ